ncbi:MAG: phosphate/phosphite/phosphonate ABC transporter substrate-binding protein [Gammaproteobacteria bacterium]|nr:phosphate/phosphite/phosphonate ABC transporter substrate-binding protein [Gammaproteobacteria bacterium]
MDSSSDDMIRHALLAAAALILAVACAGDPDQARKSPITVGVLPEQRADALRRQIEPLLEHIERESGLSLELVLHDSYEAFSSAFAAEQLDLAWFGGLTYLVAEESSNARPIVMRDIDSKFTSVFIVRGDAPGSSVTDYSGQRFSFGPDLSTSGHLMPRYFLGLRGIEPESFFASVQHFASHDRTAYAVRDNLVDIGVVNHVVLKSMIGDGRLAPGAVRILEISPTYANYVWAVRDNLEHSSAVAIRDAFLALDPYVEAHRKILAMQGASGYLPAMRADFDEPRAAAAALGLLGETR